MSAHELNRALAFAAACAAFTCGRPGADPPRLSEIGAGPIDALFDKWSAPG
jgi:fructokinase